MHVTAISTPRYPEWRWRIKGYAGETLEQSSVGLPTTTAAMAAERSVWLSVSVVRWSDATARPGGGEAIARIE